MKIKEPVKGNSKAIKRFNNWLEYQQNEKGLQWVHIGLDMEKMGVFKKKPLRKYIPKVIRNIYNRYLVNKILNEFVDMQKGIENGSIKTRPFTEEL